jgi:ribosomal protein L22
MSTLVFDLDSVMGTTTIEYEANSDRQLLHYLASAINNAQECTIWNVRIY